MPAVNLSQMASSQSRSSPQRASAAETLMLLQPPRKWTKKHLEVARVRMMLDVPPSGIVEDKFIPKDGDAGTGDSSLLSLLSIEMFTWFFKLTVIFRVRKSR